MSFTKKCETLIEQTHRKAEETLDFKMIKPRETFHFKPPIQIKGNWMVGLTNLQVHNFFNINHTNNKFELFTDTFDEFSFDELKDEVDEILNIPIITDCHLEDETIGPRLIKTFGISDWKNQVLLVILLYYWVMLHLLFEILKVILDL